MAGPHHPFGLPDSDLPHQKYMYVCMYVCMSFFWKSRKCPAMGPGSSNKNLTVGTNK